MFQEMPMRPSDKIPVRSHRHGQPTCKPTPLELPYTQTILSGALSKLGPIITFLAKTKTANSNSLGQPRIMNQEIYYHVQSTTAVVFIVICLERRMNVLRQISFRRSPERGRKKNRLSELRLLFQRQTNHEAVTTFYLLVGSQAG